MTGRNKSHSLNGMTVTRGRGDDGEKFIVVFPKNNHGRKSHNFSAYKGRGIDSVVTGCKKQIDRFIEGRDRQIAFTTIVGCCTSLPHFFDCLAAIAEARGEQITLAAIDRSVLISFLQRLAQSGMNIGGQKKRYDFVKLVLSAMDSRSLLSIRSNFPKNPFPNSNRLAKSFKPYTTRERTDIARALKFEVANTLDQQPGELTSTNVACCLLAIALRTGRNETPLLEMELDALRPHYKSGMRTLVLRKRRSARDWNLPQPEWTEEGGAVLAGTVRIIERMKELTAPLREDAIGDDKVRLWLFRSAAQKNSGKVISLTKATLHYASKQISIHHNLRDDDGKLLSINLKRLRKTFVNRVYEISGQDIAVTAKAAGHTPKVAATSYLTPDKQSQENWRFMGEAMVDDLSSETPLKKTPAGRCKDQYSGEYAPKNGATCISFINCFRCASYVVTPEDMYKVLSLYRLLVHERARIGRSKWKRLFGNVIRTIDRDIIAEGVRKGLLTDAVVEEARRKAEVEPHPFWASSKLEA
jgi:hypothetical protein